MPRYMPEPGDPDLEKEYGCAFVLDGPDAAHPATFCGAARMPGSAYCAPHHAKCYLASGSAAEQRELREIEALAEAVGGKSGKPALAPPPHLLHRLARIARAFSSSNRSRIVPKSGGGDAASL